MLRCRPLYLLVGILTANGGMLSLGSNFVTTNNIYSAKLLLNVSSMHLCLYFRTLCTCERNTLSFWSFYHHKAAVGSFMTAVFVVTRTAVQGNWPHQMGVKKEQKAGAQQQARVVMAFHSAKGFNSDAMTFH